MLQHNLLCKWLVRYKMWSYTKRTNKILIVLVPRFRTISVEFHKKFYSIKCYATSANLLIWHDYYYERGGEVSWGLKQWDWSYMPSSNRVHQRLSYEKSYSSSNFMMWHCLFLFRKYFWDCWWRWFLLLPIMFGKNQKPNF